MGSGLSLTRGNHVQDALGPMHSEILLFTCQARFAMLVSNANIVDKGHPFDESRTWGA